MTRQRFDQQIPYRLHPVDVPAKSRYKEKPSRVPELSTDVMAPTAVGTFLAICLSWATVEILGWEKSLAKGIGLGAGFGVLFLIWRLIAVFDSPDPEVEEVEYQELTWAWDTDPEDRLIPRNNGQAEYRHYGDRLLVGQESGRQITLSGRQVQWFVDQVKEGNDHLRRITTSQGLGTSDPEDGCGIYGSRYSLLLAILKENKMLDDNSQYTAAFYQFLGVSAPPAPEPGQV